MPLFPMLVTSHQGFSLTLDSGRPKGGHEKVRTLLHINKGLGVTILGHLQGP